MHCEQLLGVESAPCRTEVWDGNPHAQGSPSCPSNAPTFSLTQYLSPGRHCFLSPSQQPVIKELDLGRKQIKHTLPFPPCSHSVENKDSFLRGSSDLISAGSLCLRDRGWQGTVFIRQLCRREMVQTSSCYQPPRLPSLRRGGRSNPHPRQLESINSLYIPTADRPPSHSLGEEQGILIISVIQM